MKTHPNFDRRNIKTAIDPATNRPVAQWVNPAFIKRPKPKPSGGWNIIPNIYP